MSDGYFEIVVDASVILSVTVSDRGVEIDTYSGTALVVPLSEVQIFCDIDENDSPDAAKAKLLADLDALKDRVRTYR